jgi:hypothetical protein
MMAWDIADKANGEPGRMQTALAVGVVEDAVEHREDQECSTWNIRISMQMRVPRGTSHTPADVQNAVVAVR